MTVSNVSNSGRDNYTIDSSFSSIDGEQKKMKSVTGSVINTNDRVSFAVVRHNQVDSCNDSQAPSIDFATWQSDVAPGCWSVRHEYKPGDQVIFGKNVYQVPSSGGNPKGVVPGTVDSRWLYHGTVENNYKYYVNSHGGEKKGICGKHPLYAPPTETQRGDEVNALDRLKSSFHASFNRLPVYLGVWGASGANLYGGSNSSNRNSQSYKFASYEKTLKPGEQPLPKGGVAHFFYLRPEDKGSAEPIDPTTYRYVPFPIRLRTQPHDLPPVVATAVMPQEWRADAIAIAKPDYGYLFVPVFGPRKSPGTYNVDPNLEFFVHGPGDRNYLIQYKD